MLRTLPASQPNFVRVLFWSDAFQPSVNVNGAAVAVPLNETVFVNEPDLSVSVPLNVPTDVGANLTVTEPPVVESDCDEIENPVPEIDAVTADVRFEPLIDTLLVRVSPLLQENDIEVGLTVIVGSGTVTVVPLGSTMSLLSNTRRS